MNCDQARADLNARLDDETSSDALDRHLHDCDACRRYAVELQLVAEALHELRCDTEPIGLPVADRRLAVPVRRATPARSWIRVAGGIAAAIAIVTTSWHYTRPATRLPGTTPSAPVVSLSSEPVDAPVLGGTNPLLGITLRGESANRYLAVADASSNDAVQVYHLYPLLADRRSASAP